MSILVIKAIDKVKRASQARRQGTTVAVLVSVTLIAGCSAVPDVLNPVEWYRGTVDFFADSDQARPVAATTKTGASNPLVAQRLTSPPGSDKPTPSLGAVPERPRVMSEQEKAQIAQGLTSDSQRRQYSNEVIRRQGLETSPSPLSAPTSAAIDWNQSTKPATLQPVPPAQPVAPVAVAPITKSASMASAPPPPPASELKARPAPVVASAPAFAPETDPFATVIVSSSGVSVGGTVVSGAAVSGGGASFDRMASTVVVGGGAPIGSRKVATIQFVHGSAKFNARDRQVLHQVYQLARAKGALKLYVQGHASSRTGNMDPIRHKMVNYRISAERADAVARELIRLGLKEDNVLIAARSDVEPLYLEVMPSGEAGNRRTEIYIDY